MKRLLYISPLFLVGCAATEWLVKNSETIEKAAETATGVAGPYGPVVALGLTTIVGLAKWWEHKANAKDVIKAIQKAKSDLPEASQKILGSGLKKLMPDSVQNYVKKVKEKL